MAIKKYNISMHITPDLRAYIGMSSNGTWKYEGHWRGSNLEMESAKFGWNNISHTLVEEGLTKQEALKMREELIASSGCIGINQRACRKDVELTPKNVIKMKDKQISLMTTTVNSVKLSLTFDNRYCSKNGYPVVVRVYRNREWGYVPTGYSMSAEEFKNLKGSDYASIEKKFNTVKDWCVNAVDNGTFSIKGAKSCLKEQQFDDSLEGLIRMKMKLLDNPGTLQNYKSTIRQIKLILGDITLKDVTPENMKKFVDGLREQRKSDTTINIYLSVIKASLNYGIYKGLFQEKNYPFKKNAWEYDKVSIPKSLKRDDRYLDITEIKSLWNEFMTNGDKWLGIFLFSYFTGGMNMADIVGLKFDREWIKKRTIRWCRKKTAHKRTETNIVPVSSFVDQILSKMNITPTEGQPVFSFLDGEYHTSKHRANISCNNYLSKRNISMTYARHSFGTNATRIGMPAVMVENSMGHSLSGVQSHYIASFSVEDMRPWFEKLI